MRLLWASLLRQPDHLRDQTMAGPIEVNTETGQRSVAYHRVDFNKKQTPIIPCVPLFLAMVPQSQPCCP